MDHLQNAVLLHWLYAGVLFVMGLAMGSFLNVVAYRAPLEISLLEPPSSCPACGKKIWARDNLPLLGWLRLGGKCRFCRAPISVRYPLVELAAGVLWAAVGWRAAGLQYGYWANVFIGLLELAFVSAMLVTFLVDMDFLIILDEISLGGTAVALIASALLPALHRAETPDAFAAFHPLLADWLDGSPAWVCGLAASLIGLAAGLAFSLLIYHLGNFFFKKQIQAAQQVDPDIDSALGLGDVKLMALFGAFLGWRSVFFIFLAGSIIGAVVGSAMKLASGDPEGKKGLAGLGARWRNGDSVLPFGPFLVLGALLYLFAGEPILGAAFALLEQQSRW